MSGDEGAKAIAEIVQKVPDLTDLRFSGTRAGRAGSLVFAEALRARQLLVTVDFADNTPLGPTGASYSENGCPRRTARHLSKCSMSETAHWGTTGFPSCVQWIGEVRQPP